MHKPVLLESVINGLQLKPGGTYIDGTVGAGGHSQQILQHSSPDGRLLAFDQDPVALEIAKDTLRQFGERVTFVLANFEGMHPHAARHGLPQANGILLDLGVSSMQFDAPERGFSFQEDGPLDMRMGPHIEQSAADWVNTLSQDDLADLIYQYGEERESRRIARFIIENRPIHQTKRLADIVIRAKRSRRKKIHPATQTFQALRIAVNDELGAVERVLPQIIDLLQPGGRICIISFHSLEDRLVKQFFRQESTACICPPEQPVCTCSHQPTIKLITRKPIIATATEISENPRARSAKLRVAEKVRHHGN